MDDFTGAPCLFPKNSGMLRPTWAPELSAPSAALPGQEHPTVVLCNSIQAFILLLLALPLMHIDSPAVIFQQVITTEQYNRVLQELMPKTDPHQRRVLLRIRRFSVCFSLWIRPLSSRGHSRSLRQYWVQSLSVQAEHCRAALEWSQNRSGYSITHSSHTSHAAAAITTRERA